MTGMKKKRVNRWIILLGLTFVAALVLALIIVALYRPSHPVLEAGGRPVSDFPASLVESVTAQSVYPLAVDVAQSRQPDGQPAIVSANWRPRQGRWLADVVWMFQFYSPATRRLAVIIVDGGRARLLREATSPYPLPTLGEDDWQVDSLAALEAWWNAGGATFQAIHSEVNLTAQLRMQAHSNRLVWTITGVSGNQVRSLIVDGATGERVQD